MRYYFYQMLKYSFFSAVLEYDQTLPVNNNRANFVQEQRYVEQERPINSHIGLALLAVLIFPPVGKSIDLDIFILVDFHRLSKHHFD